ncbi:MAG: PepSY-like domain-containing protein [Bacteroidales bacterium]
MRKTIMTLATGLFFMATTLSASYADETTFPADQLPEKAKQFIKNNFSGKKIIYTGIEEGAFKGDYKVILSDNSKIEFSSSGNWEKVDCGKGCVPTSVLPTKIKKYISTNHKDVCVSEIEYDTEITGNSYKVELQNGIDLKFNKDGDFKEIDD